MANPYVNDEANGDLWGIFQLDIADEVILYVEYDMSSVIEWFHKVKDFLLIELFPFEIGPLQLSCKIDEDYPTPLVDINKEKSIAEIEYIVRPLIVDLNEQNRHDKYIDILTTYTERHYLNVRGTCSQGLFIGINSRKVGELSYYNKEEAEFKCYNFDIVQFKKDIEEKVQFFIATWKEKYYTEPGLRNLNAIFNT